MKLIGKLYGEASNIRVQKCLIASKLSSAELDFDISFKMAEDNKSEEYLKKFPLGQVPAFEMAKLQKEALLLRRSIHDQAKIVQLSFFAETQIVLPCVTIFGPILRSEERTTFEIESASYKKLDQALAYLNVFIEDRRYLVGNEVSVADIIFMGAVFHPLAIMLGRAERANYPNLMHWFKNIVEIPDFKQILGDFKYNPIKLSIVNNSK